ncbi:protein translocase subunit SecF [Streptomyces acidiscabies]|uniref:protein translocase subunit SecF n=1 Tax=Streptomyces acidiscabies TaxID=42234 RepID=UPI002FF3EF4B
MSKLGNIGARLHRGEISYDFIGHRKIWYGVSILITITAIVGLAVRGLNMGIDFQGGAVFTTPKTSVSVSQAEDYAKEASGHDAVVQKLGNGSLRIQIAGMDTQQSDQIKNKLASDFKVDTEKIAADLVGPSWGDQIANKAWQGLAIFMVLVVIYLAIAFEWRMAIAALVALIHDITITVGIYALVGFEVTPGTVIGLLTILGYSLYDTVVVFDSLKEQTKEITKQTRWTYSDIANRSINGTLVRSVNTTVVALLPGPRRLPGSPRPGPVDHAGGPRKQMNTAPVDHGVLYAARSTKVPCSFLHHPLPSFPSLRRPAWRPSARMPRETKSAAWLPSSSRSPILAGRAGCATGSPRCWPWWSVR